MRSGQSANEHVDTSNGDGCYLLGLERQAIVAHHHGIILEAQSATDMQMEFVSGLTRPVRIARTSLLVSHMLEPDCPSLEMHVWVKMLEQPCRTILLQYYGMQSLNLPNHLLSVLRDRTKH